MNGKIVLKNSAAAFLTWGIADLLCALAYILLNVYSKICGGGAGYVFAVVSVLILTAVPYLCTFLAGRTLSRKSGSRALDFLSCSIPFFLLFAVRAVLLFGEYWHILSANEWETVALCLQYTPTTFLFLYFSEAFLPFMHHSVTIAEAFSVQSVTALLPAVLFFVGMCFHENENAEETK
ncbi:MAG: hypothetical protein ACI4LB_04565 [Candidatus Fimenecus sp.]